MGPGSIEVIHIGVEYPVELLLMQDEQMIETLASHTSEKAFTDGIRLRDVIGCFENLDSTCPRGPAARRGLRYFWMVHLQTRRPSLIKATVSAEILGLAEVALDLYFQ